MQKHFHCNPQRWPRDLLRGPGAAERVPGAEAPTGRSGEVGGRGREGEDQNFDLGKGICGHKSSP